MTGEEGRATARPPAGERVPAPYETPPLTPEQRRRLRRTGITFITICIALELAVGIGSLGDLRRLSTPGGVGKLWVQAAASRDCDALFDLMRDAPPSDRAGKPGLTYCDEESTRYKGAIVTRVVVRADSHGSALVEVTQHGAARAASTVELVLGHVHGRWHVIHDRDLRPAA